jgi:hypothetical protein
LRIEGVLFKFFIYLCVIYAAPLGRYLDKRTEDIYHRPSCIDDKMRVVEASSRNLIVATNHREYTIPSGVDVIIDITIFGVVV